MTSASAVPDEIRSFIVEVREFFARWNNGDADLDEIDWLADRLSDDWHLVAAAVPDDVFSRDDFLSHAHAIHGQFADDPATPRVDFLVVARLAPDVHLVSMRQHYDFSSGATDSRVVTVVITREDGRLKVRHVHE